MTEPQPPDPDLAGPGDRPPAGQRRLAAPPSQRYATPAVAESVAVSEADHPSLARGAAVGALVALLLAAILVLFGVLFTFSAGLIVVAAFLGRLVAGAVTAGARDAGTATSRLVLAVGLSLAGVAVAQVGLWLWAGMEGGVLNLVDYLAEAYGPLVPLQFLLAGGVAALSTK